MIPESLSMTPMKKIYPPHLPMVDEGHYLGTDNTGRDIVA